MVACRLFVDMCIVQGQGHFVVWCVRNVYAFVVGGER